jgi:hypothetical protein
MTANHSGRGRERTAHETKAAMHVLVTNDDGIDAPGLRILADVARHRV